MSGVRTELVKWSGTFSCGIKLIDNQHKELVDMLNEMFLHVSGSKEDELDYINGILQKLISYVKTHFATEERIMKTTKFAGYAKHKQVHDVFILNVIDAIEDLRSGKHMSLFTFTKFLKDWIFSHIAIMDKEYFEYFKHIATRKENGKLSITPKDLNIAIVA